MKVRTIACCVAAALLMSASAGRAAEAVFISEFMAANTGVLEDEDHCAWLDRSESNARWFGEWLCFIEGWVDILICLEAQRLAGQRWRMRTPRRQPICAIRTSVDGLTSPALALDETDRAALVGTLEESTARLERLIDNPACN